MAGRKLFFVLGLVGYDYWDECIRKRSKNGV